MNLTEFRENDGLVTWLRKLLDSPEMKIVMDILDEESPGKKPIHGSISPHYANISLGIVRGYSLYPQKMKALIEKGLSDADLESGYTEKD